MSRHYLKMALRSLREQGLYAWINVVGLAVGITLCVLIVLFVVQERSYDRLHPDREQIFRIAHEVTMNDRDLVTALTPGPLAARLTEDFAGIETSCRLYRERQTVVYGENRFLESDFLFVDPSCADLFALHFVAGDAATALQRPQTVVVTARTAHKYFGEEPPLGRALVVSGEAYTVAGVVEDLSHRSHLAFDFLAPLSSLPSGAWIEGWSPHIFYTYVKLREGFSAGQLADHLDQLVDRELGPRFTLTLGEIFTDFLAEGHRFTYFLQPLGDIHLDSHLDFELQPNGNRQIVNSLAALALLILLIACVNYLNLATARATKRALEVGLRRVVGAERRQLVAQFLIEAMLTTFGAAALAAVFLAALWRPASAFLDGDTMVGVLARPGNLLVGVAGVALLGLLAGAYPAFVLSSIPAVGMLRPSGHPAGRTLRRLMVIGQFAIAMALLVFTLVIHRQITYLSRKDLGFEPAGVLVVNGVNLLGKRWEGFKQEVLRIEHVTSASAATSVPGRPALEGYLYPETSTRQEDLVSTWVFETDPDFVRTLRIRLEAGEDRRPGETDAHDVILVSAMVPLRLGWASPVSRLVTVGKVPATIRGVFDDVFVQSLHHPLQETVIRPLMRLPQVLAVRVDPGFGSVVGRELEATWRSFAPDQPFQLAALDQEIEALYEPERRVARVIAGFAVAGVLLACFGSFGLAAFTAEQRTREIGIRKAVGGTAGQVAAHLSREFFILVVVGDLLAVPAAWYFSRRWLEGFAFHVQLSWQLVAGTGILVLAIALITVGSQSVRASLANPADTLRYE